MFSHELGELYRASLKQLLLAKGSKHEYETYKRDASIFHLSDAFKVSAKYNRKSDLLHVRN